VTLFVQLVQVPDLDNRIYPRFIFLWEFCTQTLTYKSRAKYQRHFMDERCPFPRLHIFIAVGVWEIPANREGIHSSTNKKKKIVTTLFSFQWT
jgi:hypothetical protein